jgi:hypothetical protein
LFDEEFEPELLELELLEPVFEELVFDELELLELLVLLELELVLLEELLVAVSVEATVFSVVLSVDWAAASSCASFKAAACLSSSAF